MKLSIVIPCYEEHRYLNTLLLSIQTSIYNSRKEADIEVIVLDDCSINCEIENIAKKYGNFRYIKNTKNIGLFSNWDKAFKIANGEYVSIICQDDIMGEQYVKSFFSALEKYNDIDIYYSNFQCFEEVDSNIDHDMKIPFGLLNKSHIIEFALKNGFGIPGISTALKKEIYLSGEGFDTENMGANDWFLYYRNLEWNKCFGDKKKLIYYRQHNSSGSSIFQRVCQLSVFILYHDLYEINKLRNKHLYYKYFINASFNLWFADKEKYKGNRYISDFYKIIENDKVLKVLHYSFFMHAKRVFSYLMKKFIKVFRHAGK